MAKKESERTQKILAQTQKQLHEIPKGNKTYFTKALHNCENMIGTVAVPVGIAGPLLINGTYSKGNYVIPLATTEGKLVASVNRGCKAITKSGGVSVQIEKIGITRAPVFRVDTIEQQKTFITWLLQNETLLKQETKKTSHYLELIKLESRTVMPYIFVTFYFDAKDAMGMNMATSACDYLIRTLITPKTHVRCIALSSNYCTDKKPAALNLIRGRGFSANAFAYIPQEIVKTILKTTLHDLEEVYHAKIVTGSLLAGALGANAHIANIIAAIYIATGQDPAHVVEGSLGSTELEIKDDMLYIAVQCPCIVCGVVGGGTDLPKQHEALELLDVMADPKNPGIANYRFAEIIAAACLAGEISLLAALASGDLARAHDEGRKII